MTTNIRGARSGYQYATTADLDVKHCPVCGVLYAVDAALMKSHDRHGTSWFCPNGHSLHFTTGQAQREKERADAAEARARSAESTARHWRERNEEARRSLAATKGHLTRMKNRIINGVCPVPGCKRSGFSNVMRHVAAKHPEWHHDHADDLRRSEGETPA